MLNNGELGLIVENSEEGIYQGMKKALTEPESFSGFTKKLQNYTMPFNLDHSVARIVSVLDEL